MNNQSLVKFLKRNRACGESLKWLGERDLAQAWAECERGDWLIWLAAKVGLDRKRLVMAACACARLAQVHVRVGEERPRIAIETAEAWCRGEATIEQVREARKNASDASAAASYAAAASADAADAAVTYADATAAYAAAYAADAAAYAADAAYAAVTYAASDASAAASYAADAAAYAADAAYAAVTYADATADAARRATQQKTAGIVRSMITMEEVEVAIRAQGRQR